MNDAEVPAIVVSVIAAWTNVSTSAVEVAFSAARRLRHSGPGRSLAAGLAQVAYVISVPTGDAFDVDVKAEIVVGRLQALNPAAATTALQSALSDQLTSSFYTVSISSFATPRLAFVMHTTTRTTTTTTIPALLSAEQDADEKLNGAGAFSGLVAALCAIAGCCCLLICARVLHKACFATASSQVTEITILSLSPAEAGAAKEDHGASAASRSDLRVTASRGR